jgi:hypothetical protein
MIHQIFVSIAIYAKQRHSCEGMTNRYGYSTEMFETPNLKIFGRDFR